MARTVGSKNKIKSNAKINDKTKTIDKNMANVIIKVNKRITNHLAEIKRYLAQLTLLTGE